MQVDMGSGCFGVFNTHCYTHSGVVASSFRPRHHFGIVYLLSDLEIVTSLVVELRAWESRA